MKPRTLILIACLIWVFVLGVSAVVGHHRVQKNDPAKAWCDAPPVDGAGAPAACN